MIFVRETNIPSKNTNSDLLAQFVTAILNPQVPSIKLSADKMPVLITLIIISKEKELATSARNKLEGKISKITKGNINSEVALDLGNQKTLTCIITNKSVKELALKKNGVAFALFKASSVILMAD